jgi:hypothetical protein
MKTMYRLIVMAVGIGAVACLAIGCGGSGAETTSAQLSRAQLVKRADALCDRFRRARQAEAAAWLREQPGEGEAQYDKGFQVVVAPSMKRQAEELEGLAAPERDAAELADLVENFEQASEAVSQRGRRGLLDAHLKDFEREAEDLKMHACANPL